MRKLIWLAACCALACGGSTDANSVAPWSGPPVDFYGGWESGVVSDETGAVPNLKVSLNILGAGYAAPPVVSVGIYGVADLCQPSGEDLPFDAIETPDKHGFDGNWKPRRGGGPAPAEIHARVDSSGAMHGQIRVFDGYIAKPTGASTPCAPTWTFIAHRK